jgi:hypothetical protein
MKSALSHERSFAGLSPEPNLIECVEAHAALCTARLCGGHGSQLAGQIPFWTVSSAGLCGAVMKRWLLTVLLQLDELVSAAFGGYAHETISSRFSRNASEGGLAGCIFCRLIQVVWADHCNLANSKAQQLVRPNA